jgi:hypothetical protein
MSALQNLSPLHGIKSTVFLFGANPWTHYLALKQCADAGMRVVVVKTVSDQSEEALAAIHRSDRLHSVKNLPHDSEILPDAVDAISPGLVTRLREEYGDDWYALPLNDYVTEYAAAFSSLFSAPCYPPGSAMIVKRKHELRRLWNEHASQFADTLQAVEYCYLERHKDDDGFDYSPSPGFEALPEETAFVVKPDELSSSIEIHSAASKAEAMKLAQQVCECLLSIWSKAGKKIGTEVLPRVVIEAAIQRSAELHPGAEFSVEFVSHQGQHYAGGITQKWTGPGFIESGHVFPAESFPEHLRQALEQSISALLEQLNVRYGVSHWEFIVTPEERIALVEGHLRPAGGRILELVEHSTGAGPVAALYQGLIRDKAEFSFVPRQTCGLFWMVPQEPLVEVDEIKIDSEVRERLCLDLFVNQEGIKATPNWSRAKDWTKRFAHVMAAGENLDSILSRCREVARSVVLYGKTNAGRASTPLVLAIDN